MDISTSRMSLITGLLLISISAGRAIAGDVKDLRQKLADSKAVSTLYTIDENLTLVTAREEDFSLDLKNLCTEAGGELEKAKTEPDGWDSLKCKDFEAVPLNDEASSKNSEKYFIIKHSTPQSIAYKNSKVPPFERISTPKNGEVKEKYTGVEMYEFAYALCKKNSGTPLYVVPRRYGKYVRFTQVGAIEAFNYFLSRDERKDAWFFACDGGAKRFVVENYMYMPGEDNKFYFYSNRGLDGISYVKANDTGNYMAGLKALQKKSAAAN